MSIMNNKNLLIKLFICFFIKQVLYISLWKQYLDKNGEKMKKMQIHLFPRYLLLDEKGEILEPDIPISKVEEVLKEKLL